MINSAVEDQCDVAIIGAGLAGLCAGAYLTREGYRVRLFEQSEYTGGYFRSFSRDGFMFDAGLKAVENAGMLLPMLRELKIDAVVNLHKSDSAMVLPDRFVPLKTGSDFERVFEALGNHFPDQRRGLALLLKQADKIAAWVNMMVTAPNPLFTGNREMVPALLRWILNNVPSLLSFRKTYSLLDVPLEDFLSRYLDRPELIDLLSELFFQGTPALFGLGYSRVYLDYYYPHNGMQSLTDALTGYITEHGGVIQTQSRVKRILVENKTVRGIELEEGSPVHSEFVIAASDMKRTYMELLDPGELPAEFRSQVTAAAIGESAVCVFLATDIKPEDLPVYGCSHIYYLPDYQGTNADQRMDGDYFSRTPLEISIPCINNPHLAPHGKSGIIISALAKYEFSDNWGISNDEPTAGYHRLKETVADQMVALASQVIPGLAGHTLFREIATPHTYQRYTLNSQGSICGWTYDRRTTFNPRGVGGIQSSIKTPVEGLFQAGHWTVYPGGAPVCILSGRMAADHIDKQLKNRKNRQARRHCFRKL